MQASAAWEASAFTTVTSVDDGWTTPEARLAHLVAWEERAAACIAERAAEGSDAAAPPVDIDAFNAAAVDRFAGTNLWTAHDDASTAVLDAARRWPDARRAVGPLPDPPLRRAHG